MSRKSNLSCDFVEFYEPIQTLRLMLRFLVVWAAWGKWVSAVKMWSSLNVSLSWPMLLLVLDMCWSPMSGSGSVLDRNIRTTQNWQVLACLGQCCSSYWKCAGSVLDKFTDKFCWVEFDHILICRDSWTPPSQNPHRLMWMYSVSCECQMSKWFPIILSLSWPIGLHDW